MATRWGQTSYQHKDSAVQKEFERISRDISTLTQTTTATPTGKDSNVSTPQVDTGLTTKLNGAVIPTAKKIQGLNFIGRDTGKGSSITRNVVFQLEPAKLENQYSFGNVQGIFNQTNIRATIKDYVLCGDIEINRLYDDSDERLVIDEWKRGTSLARHWKPANGYYGWAVYNYIDHGWILDNPNDFEIDLVDLHSDESDIVWAATKGLYPQVNRPEVEGLHIIDSTDGLEKDIVVIRTIYKQAHHLYRGITYNIGEPDYEDEAQTMIKTNINFHYVLRRK